DYTPGLDFNGIDTVIYTVCDAGTPAPVECVNDTLFVTVNPVNDQPVITAGDTMLVVTIEDTPITICIETTDIDGDSLDITTSFNGPADGAITGLNDGDTCFTYAPDLGYLGGDTVSVVICESNGGCDTVVVIISVAPVINNPPVITDTLGNPVDTILETTPVDVPITICFSVNDTDVDSLQVTTTLSGPTNGSITGTGDGDTCLVYTPDLGYVGGDTVSVVICDNNGGCDTVVVVISVTPATNNPPVIVDAGGNPTDTILESTPVNVPITICLEAIDADGDSLEVTTAVNGPTSGSISGIGTGDTCLIYTPGIGYVGNDTVSVIVCDNNGGCDTVIVIINVTPLPPIAVDDFAATSTGIIGITILDNDTDPQGSILTYSILTGPSNGVAANDLQGIIYTPEDDYCGIDNIQYQICNEYGLCDTAWVYITVTPADSDGDGIPDYVETTSADTDGDGELDYLSLDSDGDGISDSQEAGMFIGDPCIFDPIPDCNADGIPDYQDAESCEIVSFEIPEGFSPNGDNVNDYFEIKGLEEYPDNSIIIFNRWGNKVFAAEPYDNNWRGTNAFGISFGGEDLPEGTYFYLLKLTPDDEPIKGYVYITR
ncbi:MAG: tandem-95 repeat protein, partial [Flavobacteriales bacterium]|nr:tandem-95 repeat protein [Flavobacteriales bacterium]